MAAQTTEGDRRDGAARSAVAGLEWGLERGLERGGRWVGAFHIALEWLFIAGAIFAARKVDVFAADVVAFFWIGARQHALLALAHEAAHGRLLRPLLQKRTADFLTEALVAWPLLASMRGYRRVHLAHHRFLMTNRDPDWARNRPDRLGRNGSRLANLRHVLGLVGSQRSLLAMFVGQPSTARSDASARTERLWFAARLGYYAATLGAVAALDAWRTVGIYWLLPLFAWTTVLMRLRGLSEHWAVPAGDRASDTRTLKLSPLGRALFLPKNMGYHVEHHLFPGVPFQHLPELHRRLQQDPEYARQIHVTQGVPALLREIGSPL